MNLLIFNPKFNSIVSCPNLLSISSLTSDVLFLVLLPEEISPGTLSYFNLDWCPELPWPHLGYSLWKSQSLLTFVEEIFKAKGKIFRPCMSENIFILPSFVNKSLAVYRILGWESFPLRTLKAVPYIFYIPGYWEVWNHSDSWFCINLVVSLCKLVGPSLSSQHTDIFNALTGQGTGLSSSTQLNIWWVHLIWKPISLWEIFFSVIFPLAFFSAAPING